MASACVNNSIGSYTWLTPTPTLSFTRENDPESPDPADFEFRLEDPVAMLPADQLFSDGKLVPLHVTTLRPTTSSSSSSSTVVRVNSSSGGGRGDESSASAAVKSCDDISGMAMDSYLFSPKAPRCSSRWRELLGFRRLSQSQNGTITSTATTQHQPRNSKSSSIKHFLHRNSTKSSSSSSSSSSFSLDSSLNLPLLKDSDSESVSISSSRLSLSSSSSGHEHEDLPRLSLDSDKPNPNPFANPVRMRMVKPNQTGSTTSRVGRSPMRRDTSASTASRGVSVDSPRLNSSGKIVFQSLERSSSSPSSFNGGGGGQRYKQRGMERSYSANVRVTPVLNVPVCSLRGSSKSGSVFGFFSSSPQKSGATTRQLQMNNCRNRTTDRT